MTGTDSILNVENLVTRFYIEEGVVNAVNDVSFELNKGETIGIVGESGSGKSVTAMSIIGLIDSPGQVEQGVIDYRGEDLLEKSEKELRSIRGNKISMIFQDPMTSLNPVFTVGEQIKRVILKHQDMSKKEAKERTIELLADVGIPDPQSRYSSYPHQFSGGMRQRALIAMAISCEPDILIADEPTTALDVTIEAQIFDLINDLKEKYEMSVILITHDLSVVADTCDRVAIMYGGQIVERADIDDIFLDPRHPYTRGLLRSMPSLSSTLDRLEEIGGEIPDPISLPNGCSFHPRCPHATQECVKYDPELREVEPGHQAACIYAQGYGSIEKMEPTVTSPEVTTDGAGTAESRRDDQ